MIAASLDVNNGMGSCSEWRNNHSRVRFFALKVDLRHTISTMINIPLNLERYVYMSPWYCKPRPYCIQSIIRLSTLTYFEADWSHK